MLMVCGIMGVELELHQRDLAKRQAAFDQHLDYLERIHFLYGQTRGSPPIDSWSWYVVVVFAAAGEVPNRLTVDGVRWSRGRFMGLITQPEGRDRHHTIVV